MQACLLIYDIPDEADIPNPSTRLRRIAVRVNLSCWVIREGDIPYNYLQYLKDNGATWHVVKFDVTENVKLLRMAIDSIKSDIRMSISRAKASAESAACKLQDESLSPEERRKKYDASTRATIKRLKNTLNSLKEAAKLFGISNKDISLNDAEQQCRAIQSAMHGRAEAYQMAINRLSNIFGENNGMVRSARADKVPAKILADYLEDTNERENIGFAQKLRGMFD